MLGNMLAGKGIVRGDSENKEEKGIGRAGSGNKKGKGIVRAGHGNEMDFNATPTHPLTNFEIQKYYQKEPRFNDVYSRNNLPEKIKDGAYVITLDEYA